MTVPGEPFPPLTRWINGNIFEQERKVMNFAKTFDKLPHRPDVKSGPLKTVQKRHLLRSALIALATVLIIGLIAARLYLPVWVKDYANETLNNIKGYSGSIADVDIHLYRGAYTIHGLKLDKKAGGDIPVPFLSIDKSDLSIQWGALFRGRIVGDVTLTRPVINFATGKSGRTSQTGVETDWTKPIKDLMPLDINWAEINNGRIAYKDFSSSPNVDLFIDDMYLKATNLRNVEDKKQPFPSALTLRGNSIGGGKLNIDGNVNILKKTPDMDLKGKLESVSLPAMNDYARAFAGIDFTKGRLDIYSDLLVKDNKVSGYVKPLATGIELIDTQKQDTNPFNVLWESIVSVVIEIFSNQSKDQFATQVQLEGPIDSPETSFWATLNGIQRNAFVKAFSRTITEE